MGGPFGDKIQRIKELEVFSHILFVFGCLVQHFSVEGLIGDLLEATPAVWLCIGIGPELSLKWIPPEMREDRGAIEVKTHRSNHRCHE